MKNIHHELRTYRKESPFSLEDVADMLGTIDATQIGRHETNTVSPQLEVSLLYHLLFRKPVPAFFPEQMQSLIARLKVRIPNLIDELKCMDANELLSRKIEYLQAILADLDNHNTL